MKLLLVFFVFLFLGIIFSKIEVEINNIDFSLNSYHIKKLELDNFDVDVSLLIFSIIKILKINVNNKGVIINGIRLNINIKKYKYDNKKIANILKKDNKIINNLKNIDLNLKYSTSDAFATAMIFPMLNIIIQNIIARCNFLDNSNFRITPFFYNVNSLKLSANSLFVFSFFEFMNIAKQIV